ncbi:hypothetical protein GCM10027047_03400 [Rhodococcus aerolatus]
MTRTGSTLHSSHRTLTFSLSAPGGTAPAAGAGIVGALLGAVSSRRARRVRG